MSVRFVLDSWAVLLLLESGPNAGKVNAAIDSGDADAVVADVRAKVDVKLPDMATFRDAARIKAAVAMSYADAFAAATAARYRAPVLTGDPELLTTPDPSLGLPSWTWTDLR